MRPLVKSDFPPIVDVWERAWRGDDGGAEALPMPRAAFEARLLGPGGLDTLTAVVIAVGHRVAGFVLLDLAAGVVVDLVVDPDHARQGLGRRLADAAASLVQGPLRATVPDGAARAAAFCDRIGLRRAG